MKFLSVCSGIEAASVAWHPLGWKALAFSEIETFPRALLAHHYPHVPLHGDFTVLRDQPWIVNAECLVGGTPCQAFSVAGKRNSLADERGNLTLEFVRLADAIDNLRRADGRRPAIIVWENVPGVLSVKDNAFGCFLGALAGSDAPIVPTGGKWSRAGVVVGPERRCAWRVLDAQYFGVAQRRRRVFVVASARDDIHPAEVLFEREGVRRDTPPSRSQGQTAPTIPARSTAGGGLGTDFDCDEGLISGTLDTMQRGGAGTAPTSIVAFHPTQDPITSDDGTTHALGCGSKQGQASVAVASNTSVRRLTPRECERLQGFPDDYTLVPVRGKPAADGPRYKALGNSMAVPVMHWIGKRIQKFLGSNTAVQEATAP